jgi:hypothetical protein
LFFEGCIVLRQKFALVDQAAVLLFFSALPLHVAEQPFTITDGAELRWQRGYQSISSDWHSGLTTCRLTIRRKTQRTDQSLEKRRCRKAGISRAPWVTATISTGRDVARSMTR